MKKLQFFPLCFLLTSCLQSGRHIASVHISPPKMNDLVKATDQVITDVEDVAFPSVCLSYLKKLEKEVDGIDVKKLSVDALRKDGEAIAKNSWEIRSILHSRLEQFDKNCATQVQANFRQLRFIEDYLLEVSRNVSSKGPSEIDFQKQPVPIMDITVPYYETRVNSQVKFEPGDLLITRGVSFLSGMIARLGSRATQFSHVVMVNENKKTKSLRTIESYVGVGVNFYDLDFALKNENARILWLRAKDKNLAKKASELMGDKVEKSLAAKKPIKYDYELDFNSPETMSCAEVSQAAFKMADLKFVIPYYPNNIEGAESLIHRLKLIKGKTFEPGDMEIDPRFELIGEFQDLRLTRDSRQKDAIMSAMFGWMEHKGYKLKDNFTSTMAGGPVFYARKTFLWPLVKKIFKVDDFSKEVPKNMLSTLSLINEIGAVMLEEIKQKDLQFEKKYGLPMSYMDFYKELEGMRVRDSKLYENKATRDLAKFHKVFRP
jgi:hypothetical protein